MEGFFYLCGLFIEMKYIISESRLTSAIMDYFDTVINIDEITWDNPTGYNNDGDEVDDPNRVYFYTENSLIFRYYRCEYFYDDAVDPLSQCPFLDIMDDDIKNQLNRIFGEIWIEPFKEWFAKNFGLKVKTIE